MEASRENTFVAPEFEEAYKSDRNRQMVNGVASQYFGPGLERQDLQQEAAIGLWKATKDYNPDRGSSFESFAMLCIERNVLTAVKAATRGKHGPLNNSLDLDGPTSGDEGLTFADMLPSTFNSTPEEILIYKEWLLSFHDIFYGFSPLEQQAYELCALQGFSYEQTGAIIGADSKAVDNALKRAKRKMESKIDSPFIED